MVRFTTSISFALGLGVAAIAMSAEPPSDRWLEVANGAQVKVYVDMESLRKTGAKVKVWTLWVYEKPRPVDGVSYAKTYLVEKNLSTYNCTERTSISMQSIKYKDEGQGEVVGSFTLPDVESGYSDVAPETLGEGIMTYACSLTKTANPAPAK